MVGRGAALLAFSVIIVLLLAGRQLPDTGPTTLYTAAHAEVAPFQRVRIGFNFITALCPES